MLPVPPRPEPEPLDSTAEPTAPERSYGRRVRNLLIALVPALVVLCFLIHPLAVVAVVIASVIGARIRFLADRQRQMNAPPQPAPLPEPTAAAEPECTIPRGPTPGVRPRSKFVAMLAFALLVSGAWAYFRPPSGDPPETSGIRSVRVWKDPWNDEQGVSPDVETNEPEAVEALATVIRSARETRDHKCGHCGIIVLRRSLGRSERLAFLPGHDPNFYEFRHGRKIYRVPRAEFLAVMRRLGIEVPLDDPT